MNEARERAHSTPDHGAEAEPDREGDEQRQRVHAPSVNQTTDIASGADVGRPVDTRPAQSRLDDHQQPGSEPATAASGWPWGRWSAGCSPTSSSPSSPGPGRRRAAPVSVLWVWWGFAGAALTFPLQHWITRTVTAHDGERALRLLGAPDPLVVVGTAAGRWGRCRGSRATGCSGRGDLGFPALVVAVTLGSGLLGVVRGTLSGRGRFAAVGASLAAENGLRCVAGAVLSPRASTARWRTARAWSSATRPRSGRRRCASARDGSPGDPGSPLALVGGVGPDSCSRRSR